MSDFLNAWRVQNRVIHAFILRETRTRFGRSKLGYLWAFFEPLAYVLSLIGIYSVTGRSAPINVDIKMFFFTGIIPWLMFLRGTAAVSGAIDANQQLLTYPQVKIMDVVIARLVLEFVTLFLVALVYLLSMFYLRVFDSIESVLFVVLSLFVSILLGGGLGLVGGVIKIFMPAYGNFQAIIVRMMFFTSGIFFVADGLPSLVVDWLWFNPMLHVIEWARSAFFYSYESRFYQLEYPLLFLASLCFIGLMAERVSRYKLRQI